MNNQGLYLVENEDQEEVLNQLMLQDPMSQKQQVSTVEDGTYSAGKKDRIAADQSGQKGS